MRRTLPAAILTKVNMETGEFGPFILDVQLEKGGEEKSYILWTKTKDDKSKNLCMVLAKTIEEVLPDNILEGHALVWVCVQEDDVEQIADGVRKLIPEINVLEVTDPVSLKPLGMEMPYVPKDWRNIKIHRLHSGGPDHLLN